VGSGVADGLGVGVALGVNDALESSDGAGVGRGVARMCGRSGETEGSGVGKGGGSSGASLMIDIRLFLVALILFLFGGEACEVFLAVRTVESASGMSSSEDSTMTLRRAAARRDWRTGVAVDILTVIKFVSMV